MGTMLLHGANFNGLWGRGTYAGDIVSPAHGHSKQRSVILCQWTAAFLFSFPWELSKVSTDYTPVVDGWGATPLLHFFIIWSFLRFLSKTSKMSTSSPEAVKKLLENMQTDLRSLSMECKKKFPPVKEVSRLISFIKPLPWFLGGCPNCEFGLNS